MIYMSTFSWISTILSILCLVWCIGLGVFVLIKKIIDKIKSKKEMKQDLDEHKKLHHRKYGSDDYDE